MLLRLENVNLTHLVLASGKLVLQKKILGLVHAALVENLDFFPFFSTWLRMFGRLLTMSCKGRRDFFVVSRKTRKRGRKREKEGEEKEKKEREEKQ